MVHHFASYISVFWFHLELGISNTRNWVTNHISSFIQMNNYHHLLKSLSLPHWWANQTDRHTDCLYFWLLLCSVKSMNNYLMVTPAWDVGGPIMHPDRQQDIPPYISFETAPLFTLLQMYNSCFPVEIMVRTTQALQVILGIRKFCWASFLGSWYVYILGNCLFFILIHFLFVASLKIHSPFFHIDFVSGNSARFYTF